MDHRLRILSKECFELSDRDSGVSQDFRNLAKEVPDQYVSGYRPIFWHKDFRSGFEWPKNAWYFDRSLTPRAGADLKIPWELSRFVHLGLLVHVDFEAAAHEYILQILDWITENSRYRGVNWASELVVALRAINWIWGLSLFRGVVNRYPSVLRTISISLYDHFQYLQRNLAYHELYTDDHYLADLVGLLYITAAFPDFPESDKWLLFAIAGMCSEMDRQVLADGYSHMMSTHYHRFVAELFASGASLSERIPEARRKRLQTKKPANAWPYVSYGSNGNMLVVSGRSVFPRGFYEQLRKMVDVSVLLTKPDGTVPQFGDNDSARAHKFIASSPNDTSDHRHLAAVVGKLLSDEKLLFFGKPFEFEGNLIAGGSEISYVPEHSIPLERIRSVLFPNCNIAVLTNTNAYLAVTCSKNGYHGKGGHGHNDKGSFELSVLGQDIFVDGGCPYYTSAPELRNAYRATSAHNTLVVSEQEQDPIPEDLFSLPSAHKSDLKMTMSDNSVAVAHDKYGTVHSRKFNLFDDHLEIIDTFASNRERYLVFNLSPVLQCAIERPECSVNRVTLTAPSGLSIIMKCSGIERIDITEGRYGVGYGQPVENLKLICYLNDENSKIEIFWRVIS